MNSYKKYLLVILSLVFIISILYFYFEKTKLQNILNNTPKEQIEIKVENKPSEIVKLKKNTYLDLCKSKAASVVQGAYIITSDTCTLTEEFRTKSAELKKQEVSQGDKVTENDYWYIRNMYTKDGNVYLDANKRQTGASCNPATDKPYVDEGPLNNGGTFVCRQSGIYTEEGEFPIISFKLNEKTRVRTLNDRSNGYFDYFTLSPLEYLGIFEQPKYDKQILVVTKNNEVLFVHESWVP